MSLTRLTHDDVYQAAAELAVMGFVRTDNPSIAKGNTQLWVYPSAIHVRLIPPYGSGPFGAIGGEVVIYSRTGTCQTTNWSTAREHLSREMAAQE